MLDFVANRGTPAGNALVKEKKASREFALRSVCPAIAADAERPSKGQKKAVIHNYLKKQPENSLIYSCLGL